MGLKYSYYNRNGKHQDKANMLLDLIPSLHEPCANHDTTNEHLEDFRRQWLFYLHFYIGSYEYNKNHALSNEKELDALILKAYNEQTKLGNI